MIDKDLERVVKVDFDTISISLYRNPKKMDYDEILVFEKKNHFYGIPFFSNMYFDFWGFKNEEQKQLVPKTNTTFDEQLKLMIEKLNLTAYDFDVVFNGLMYNVLNLETDLEEKPGLFENVVAVDDRVSKYKSENSDSCVIRMNDIYDHIKKVENVFGNQTLFLLDNNNKRVYQIKFEQKKWVKLNLVLQITGHPVSSIILVISDISVYQK